jgi:hypothetical protein
VQTRIVEKAALTAPPRACLRKLINSDAGNWGRDFELSVLASEIALGRAESCVRFFGIHGN